MKSGEKLSTLKFRLGTPNSSRYWIHRCHHHPTSAGEKDSKPVQQLAPKSYLLRLLLRKWHNGNAIIVQTSACT